MESRETGSREWRLDASGGDPAVGTLGISEIMAWIEHEAFLRDWTAIRIAMPYRLIWQIWNRETTRLNVTRIRDEGRPALKWQMAFVDAVIVPTARDERREIAVYSSGDRVGTVISYAPGA